MISQEIVVFTEPIKVNDYRRSRYRSDWASPNLDPPKHSLESQEDLDKLLAISPKEGDFVSYDFGRPDKIVSLHNVHYVLKVRTKLEDVTSNMSGEAETHTLCSVEPMSHDGTPWIRNVLGSRYKTISQEDMDRWIVGNDHIQDYLQKVRESFK